MDYTKQFELEALAQRSIINFLRNKRKEGGPIRHFKAAQGRFSEAGVSDIIACYQGRFYALEVKSKAGKPTEIQLQFGKSIEKAGGVFAIVRNVYDVAEVLGIAI